MSSGWRTYYLTPTHLSPSLWLSLILSFDSSFDGGEDYPFPSPCFTRFLLLCLLLLLCQGPPNALLIASYSTLPVFSARDLIGRLFSFDLFSSRESVRKAETGRVRGSGGGGNDNQRSLASGSMMSGERTVSVPVRKGTFCREGLPLAASARASSSSAYVAGKTFAWTAVSSGEVEGSLHNERRYGSS